MNSKFSYQPFQRKIEIRKIEISLYIQCILTFARSLTKDRQFLQTRLRFEISVSNVIGQALRFVLGIDDWLRIEVQTVFVGAVKEFRVHQTGPQDWIFSANFNKKSLNYFRLL